MDINALITQVSQQHPFYAFVAGCVIGPLWPRVITWLVTDGVDMAVPKVLAFQKFYLRKIGVTDDQLKAVEQKEAAALARAADDVKKDADAVAP